MNDRKYKYKRFFGIVGLGIGLLFVGCGDNKEQKEQSQVTQNKATPKIEIVTNTNKHEIKVANKDDGKNKKGESFYYDYGQKSEYDPKSQPANKDANVRVRPRTVLDAYSHIRSPYERVQVSLISKQLSPAFRLKCSACHDDYANGVIGPSLLGRDATYIYNKIMQFKNKEKSNPLMTDLIKKMSDEEIRSLAEDIYEFNKRVQKLRGKQ